MDTKKPEWQPEEAGKEYASFVMKGVDNVKSSDKESAHSKIVKRRNLDIDDYVAGIKKQDVSMLARAITLIESNSPKHIDRAQEIIKKILPLTGKSVRIGISGAPGAGKSTLIETFGSMLCKMGHKVAVLAIDPSSTLTKGSILGDKTRMEKLSREANAYIRPSPSGGILGGVARKTRESALLCEAAGYDIIIIETVGVGQSETTVRSMVDFFLLVLLPGGGDDLQGIKKGTVEISDALLINKAEGESKNIAENTKINYMNALHLLQPYTKGWETKVQTASALHSIGIKELWDLVQEFMKFIKDNDIFEHRRQQQIIDWVYNMLEEELKSRFYNHPSVKENKSAIERDLIAGKMTATSAVKEYLEMFFNK